MLELTNDLKKELIMICPKCGKELSDDSAFCNKCGQSMEFEIRATGKAECPDVCKPKISIWETFKLSIKSFYKDFTTGRASCKEFWSTYLFSVLFLLIPWSLCFVLTIIMGINADSIGAIFLFIPLFIFMILFCLFGTFFSLTLLRLSIRRAHDIDCPWGCIFIPVFNFIMLFLPGTTGPNKYGEEPKI